VDVCGEDGDEKRGRRKCIVPVKVKKAASAARERLIARKSPSFPPRGRISHRIAEGITTAVG
jgi:hypothetical protein